MLKYHHLLLLATNLPFTIAFKLFNATTKCPITLDGRISTSTNLSTFDTLSSPFNPDYSKGQNLSWSEILLFPSIPPSRFDSPIPLYKPLEVTISNASIFVPGGGSPQFGFRRAGLLLGNGSDASNVGVHTYHWSVMQDEKRKMNLSHEYMNVWHERNDYTANQWSLNAGVMLEQDKPLDSNVSTTGLERRLWKVLDKENDVVWTTGIKYGVWENWGLRMDVDENTLQVYYSVGNAPLRNVTGLLSNDNSGGGQLQIGMAKKPTETVTVVYDGYQEPVIDEGQIYGGIFVEDGESGCISL